MSTESQSGVTTDIIRRFTAGGSDLIVQIDRLLHKEITSKARQLIRRHNIESTLYDADDAVNDSLFELCQAAAEGGLTSVETGYGLLKVLCSILERRILDEWDREAALKRGGPGVSFGGQQLAETFDRASLRGFHREEKELLDRLEDSPKHSPVELTIAKLGFERLIEHLSDPVEKIILSMRLEHRTKLEIAKALGKSLSFVDRRLSSIRSIWEKINPGSE